MDGQLSPLPPGTPAPDFSLPRSSYASVSLADVRGPAAASQGVQVATKVLVGGGIPRAIDEGVTEQVVMEDQSPANCRAHPDVR